MTLGTLLRDRHTEIAATAWRRLKGHALASFDTELIADAVDGGPSRVVTYTQAGSQFGFNMLWTMPLAWPLIAVMREVCVHIRGVTGKGLAANIRDAYSPIVVRSVVVLLLAANILNITADVSAMGEVAELLSGFDRHLMATGIFVLILSLHYLVSFRR